VPGAGPALLFCNQCVALLHDTYLPRLRRALDELPVADLWWRPHERATSVGNLLLHLQGNVRQWIVSGLGGAPDRRERSGEFAAREGAGKAELLAALSATVDEACVVIARLDERALTAPITIQGIATTGLAAVLHVVEHFSWHTGQVTWIAKERAGAGHGLAFYDDSRLNAARNASGEAGAKRPTP
jgi:uncharacterized damage-inducible protein DinB